MRSLLNGYRLAFRRRHSSGLFSLNASNNTQQPRADHQWMYALQAFLNFSTTFQRGIYMKKYARIQHKPTLNLPNHAIIGIARTTPKSP